MPKYQVELVAKIIGFQQIEVEAASEFDARQAAFAQGQKLTDLSGWDIQYIDYHNSERRNRDGTPNCVFEVAINAIGEA